MSLAAIKFCNSSRVIINAATIKLMILEEIEDDSDLVEDRLNEAAAARDREAARLAYLDEEEAAIAAAEQVEWQIEQIETEALSGWASVEAAHLDLVDLWTALAVLSGGKSQVSAQALASCVVGQALNNGRWLTAFAIECWVDALAEWWGGGRDEASVEAANLGQALRDELVHRNLLSDAANGDDLPLWQVARLAGAEVISPRELLELLENGQYR